MSAPGFWQRARARVLAALGGAALGAPKPQPYSTQVNVADVTRTVCRYAVEIGCTPSNVAASLSYGLKHGTTTLNAIRYGRARARQLLQRQLFGAPGPRSA